MTREYAEAILRASDSKSLVMFEGNVIPASAVYDYLTDNGEYPEEADWFNSLDCEDQIKEIMSW